MPKGSVSEGAVLSIHLLGEVGCSGAISSAKSDESVNS